MKTRDPNFDLEEFEFEIKFIFEQLYRASLRHDIETIEQVCIGEALGYFKAIIESQKLKKSEPKFKEIFNLSQPHLESAILVNRKEPLFVLSLKFHEIFCLVDKEDSEEVVEGDYYKKVLNEFLLYVMIHPDP